MNQVIILAGGLGTRLKDILNGNPKPMANINGRPFIKILLLKLLKLGFKDFIFSLYYKSEILIEFLNSEKKGIFKNIKIQFIVEPIQLGTGGAISYIVNNTSVEDNFIVINADTIIDHGYDKINMSNGNNILVVKVDNVGRYGQVVFNQDNKILGFLEKENTILPGYINAGVYKLNKNLFLNWNNEAYSLETQLFPKLVEARELNAIVVNTSFIDIGIPEDYYKFCKNDENESK